jgi:hypothetical protein
MPRGLGYRDADERDLGYRDADERDLGYRYVAG